MADPVLLSQCFQNLIVNAIKYRGESNWVGLSAELHAGSGRAREVWIHVEDRGVGISEPDLLRIFHPFYRSPEMLGPTFKELVWASLSPSAPLLIWVGDSSRRVNFAREAPSRCSCTSRNPLNSAPDLRIPESLGRL